jgi:hypothetical protein
MFKKHGWVYISIIILCLILGLFFYKTAEAGIIDWLLGGVRIVEVEAKEIEVVKPSYKLGEQIPVEYVRELISQHATGTKAYQMERTIYCESHYWNVQSYIIDKSGNREDSWGIAQINLYWNPSVSREQALDPEFAIKWMSDRWGKTAWYGYINATDSCNVFTK